MIFFALLTLFIILGYVCWVPKFRDLALSLSLISIASIPSGSIFEGFIVKYGVYTFIGILIGIILGGVLKKIPIASIIYILLSKPILVTFFACFLLALNLNLGRNLIRDLRVLLFYLISITAAFFLAHLLESTPTDKMLKTIKFAVIVSFIKTMLLLILVRFYNINTSFSDDAFIVSDPRANQWYGDPCTFIGVGWLLCFAKRFLIMDLFAFAIIIASGSRTVFAITLGIYLVTMQLNIKNALILFSLLPMGCFLFVERILNIDGTLLEAFITRFSPFIKSIQTMSIYNIIWGHGLGYCFDIPWFLYRDLDESLNFIDNFYFTMFAKFGLSSLFVIYILYQSLKRILNSRIIFLWYFGLMGLTTALVFQISFPIVLFVFTFIHKVSQMQNHLETVSKFEIQTVRVTPA